MEHAKHGFRMAVALSLTADRWLAEELASWARERDIRGMAPARWPEWRWKAWTAQVIRNSHVDHRRRSRREVVTEAPPDRPAPAEESPERVLHAAQLREQIAAALLQLHPSDRAALLLRGHRVAYEQIAVELRCSPSAARKRVSRARRRLKKIMEVGDE